MLILGDRGSGKRTLVKHMNKPFMKLVSQHKLEELGSDFASFDCSFMFYKDITEQTIGMEDNFNQTRINVWLISDPDMGQMISKILKPEDLEFTFAIIMPDLEKPWELKNQVSKWMTVLKDAIYQLTPQLDLKKMEFLKQRIEELYKSYEEPEFDKDGKFISKRVKKVHQMVDADKLDQNDMDMMED